MMQACCEKVYTKIVDREYIYFVSKHIDIIDISQSASMQLRIIADVIVSLENNKLVKCRFPIGDIIKYGGAYGTLFGITEEYTEQLDESINSVGRKSMTDIANYEYLKAEMINDYGMLEDAATEYAERTAKDDASFKERVTEIKQQLMNKITAEEHLATAAKIGMPK